MEPPLYPHRDFVRAGECGREPLDHLRVWVQGGTFHRYGARVLDRDPVAEQLEAMRRSPALLEFDGGLSSWGRSLDWGVVFRQAGMPESWGSTRPHMTPEDAAYAALSMIEEHERGAYEEGLVVGLA